MSSQSFGALQRHNSQVLLRLTTAKMLFCLDFLDWETTYSWPTFALSLLRVATSQHKVNIGCDPTWLQHIRRYG